MRSRSLKCCRGRSSDGRSDLNPYARHVGVNAAKTSYATRFVVYLNAAAGDAVADSSCAALIQGGDSATRAVNFQQYLHSLYGDDGVRKHVFVMVPKVKNDAAGLFGSVCGMSVLFGNGFCSGGM